MTVFDPTTGLTFSRHSLERMEQRRVSRSEVAITLALGHPPTVRDDGRQLARAFVGHRVIEVVRGPDGVIVTVQIA